MTDAERFIDNQTVLVECVQMSTDAERFIDNQTVLVECVQMSDSTGGMCADVNRC